MLTLVQFPPLFNLPSSSPFCNKVELMLKMSGIDYQIEHMTDPRAAPKGKLPFIKDAQKQIPDSKLITAYLKANHAYNLDEHLSVEQQAVQVAFLNMLEESFYWALAYSRFCEPENWDKYKVMLFSDLPPIINKIVPKVLHKKVLKDMRSQGIGLHSRDEIYQLAKQNLEALSNYLADKAYFFGDKPATIDASAFAFLAQTANSFDNPLKDYINTLPNITAYIARIEQKYLSSQRTEKAA